MLDLVTWLLRKLSYIFYLLISFAFGADASECGRFYFPQINHAKALVIIPTYNERENIGPMIREVLAQKENLDILIVDDSSPDGTSKVVKELMKEIPGRIHLLSRSTKDGLARAYIAGLKWGMNREYEYLVQMDADFSHRPVDINRHMD